MTAPQTFGIFFSVHKPQMAKRFWPSGPILLELTWGSRNGSSQCLPLQSVRDTFSAHWEVCSSGSRGEFLTIHRLMVAKPQADDFSASQNVPVTMEAVVLNVPVRYPTGSMRLRRELSSRDLRKGERKGRGDRCATHWWFFGSALGVWKWPCMRLRVSGPVDSQAGSLVLWLSSCHVFTVVSALRLRASWTPRCGLWPWPQGNAWLPKAPKLDAESTDTRLTSHRLFARFLLAFLSWDPFSLTWTLNE